MQTKTLGNIIINIDALINLLKSKYRFESGNYYKMDELKGINKSREKGFSNERLKRCIIEYPIIVYNGKHVIDGRHRVLKKRIGNPKGLIRGVEVTWKEIQACTIAVRN